MTRRVLYEFESIGTHWWCEILSDDEFTPELIAELTYIREEFDQRYSRFRDDSLVSELYYTGVLEQPPKELIEMLTFAQQMYIDSDGAFTLAVGPRLHALGYGKRAYGGDIDQNIWDRIAYNAQRVTLPKGTMLDFGGHGKGWLIDLFVRCMRRHHIDQFIINGGGDLYVQSQQPVDIALEHPTDSTLMIGQVKLQNAALAASSTVKRRWEHNGKTHHHIIDPRTSESSETDVIASYVIAKTALIADTMATILILRPELEEKLSKTHHLQSFLIRKTAPHASS